MSRNPLDLTNAIVLHRLENGELDIMSTSTARIIVVDEQINDMHEYIVHDAPSMLSGFFEEDELRNMPVKFADDEYEEDAPRKPNLTLVK